MDSYYESIWSRGRKDTVLAAKSFPFIIVEVGGSILVGIISSNPWLALIYFVGLLVALWIGATLTSPIRQRDDERKRTRELEGLIESERLKPRILSVETQGVLAGHLRKLPPFKKRVAITYGPGPSEPIDFAVSIGDAFTMAEIDNEVLMPLAPPGPKERGVKIVHGADDAPTALAQKLQDCLAQVGIETELRPNGKFADSGPSIIVARSG